MKNSKIKKFTKMIQVNIIKQYGKSTPKSQKSHSTFMMTVLTLSYLRKIKYPK